MLSHLAIRNFTTVNQIEIEFNEGLTSITGETGAGKSVLLDALAAALGAKTSADSLRNEKDNAEVCATFLLPANGTSHGWLDARDLPATDEDGSIEVLLRRIITPSGRSRAYVNGSQVAVADLKTLGEQLVDLHGQHEHQSLLRRATHAPLVDSYGDQLALAEEVEQLATQWHELEENIKTFSTQSSERQAALQLLNYQIDELATLQPRDGETSKLANEQKTLANAGELAKACNDAITACDNEESGGIVHQLQRTIQLLQPQQENLEALGPCIELLQSAAIQISEAYGELQQASGSFAIDPERLNQIEDRLDSLYSIARKHQVDANNLASTLDELQSQAAAMDDADTHVEQLREQQQTLHAKYLKKASGLSKRRASAAKKFSSAINKKLAKLKMNHCEFAVDLAAKNRETPNPHGNETIEFLITTVPGKPPRPLSQVASGGELSRVSLAVQVVASQGEAAPTRVFDEVDVGIGGAVAEVVGNMLRELGSSCQILCVTHLAQVAAKGQSHLLVSKTVSRKQVTTSIDTLEGEERKQELARMVGGIELKESTLAHAADLMESA